MPDHNNLKLFENTRRERSKKPVVYLTWQTVQCHDEKRGHASANRDAKVPVLKDAIVEKHRVATVPLFTIEARRNGWSELWTRDRDGQKMKGHDTAAGHVQSESPGEWTVKELGDPSRRGTCKLLTLPVEALVNCWAFLIRICLVAVGFEAKRQVERLFGQYAVGG